MKTRIIFGILTLVFSYAAFASDETIIIPKPPIPSGYSNYFDYLYSVWQSGTIPEHSLFKEGEENLFEAGAVWRTKPHEFYKGIGGYLFTKFEDSVFGHSEMILGTNSGCNTGTPVLKEMCSIAGLLKFDREGIKQDLAAPYSRSTVFDEKRNALVLSALSLDRPKWPSAYQLIRYVTFSSGAKALIMASFCDDDYGCEDRTYSKGELISISYSLLDRPIQAAQE